MTWKETAANAAMWPVDAVASRAMDRQRDRLDALRREDRYALVVFDALRYDYARQILPLYLQGDMTALWSAGHDTFEYGRLCWGDRQYQTTYVSGAVPFNREADFEDEGLLEFYGGWVPGETLPNLVEAWQDTWDRSVGTTDPAALTEQAREYTDRDELAVHYFQPHAPYIGRCELLGHTHSRDAQARTGEPVDAPLWDRVKGGEVSDERLRLAYRANIHRAVEAALPLLRELCEQDRRVVVMADHGELLGDYPGGAYAHPRISFPEIRRVPWLEVEGVRAYPGGADRGHEDTAEKLRALGYR